MSVRITPLGVSLLSISLLKVLPNKHRGSVICHYTYDSLSVHILSVSAIRVCLSVFGVMASMSFAEQKSLSTPGQIQNYW